jgi:hypothetical protein
MIGETQTRILQNGEFGHPKAQRKKNYKRLD